MSSSSDERGPVELLADEFLARCKRGEKPTIKEYCDRHPELADEIRDVFEAVLMVEDLKPGSSDMTGSLGASVSVNGKRLAHVGDYRILCEIGRGGMGVVYEAEQQALGRRVALKVLPRTIAGDGSAQIRFQREAKAAARMHHTNIVPVFDVGQDGEHLYYAMQLIHGQGLDLVIDDLKRLRAKSLAGPATDGKTGELSIAASLVAGQFEKENLAIASPSDTATAAYEGSVQSLAMLPGQSDISTATSNRGAYFRSVAQIGLQTAAALSYAHGRGIIHRDIKPGNLILDTTGNVWVTDFGLAKTGDGAVTHTGDILGTVRYMSPERFRGQCDVRADVYALGMTLYEMLTLKAAFASGDRLKLIELIRQMEAVSPRSIDARVPLDLETIVMKAIDKDPKRRYQSADEMAEDLQRFVNDEPIKARRIGSVERFNRWCRRNPVVAGLSAAVMVLLALGTAVSSWQAVRAWAAERDALAAAAAAREAKHAAEEAAAAEKAAKEQAEIRLGQIEKLNDVLTSLFAELNIRKVKEGPEPLEAVLAQRLVMAAEQLEGDAVGEPLAVAGLQEHLGHSLVALGYPNEAIGLHFKARATRAALLGAEHPDTLTSMNNLASAYHEAGKNDLALPLFEEVLKLRKAKLGAEHPHTITSMGYLAAAYQDAGKLDLALPLYAEALRLSTAKLGAGHLDTLNDMNNLASAYRDAGKLDLALPLFEEALKLKKAKMGVDHPDTLMGMNNLALAYQGIGKLDLALPLLEETVKLQKAKLGAEHPSTLSTMSNLATAYQEAGKLGLALSLYEETLKLRKARLGAEHPETLSSMNNLGSLYWRQQRLDRSIPLFEETLKLRDKILGRQHPETLATLANLGVNYRDAGRLAEAIPLLEEAYASGKKHPRLHWVGSQLLDTYVKDGQPTAAAKGLASEMLEDARQQLPQDSPQLAGQLASLGFVMLKLKTFADAEPLLRESLAIREMHEPDDWRTFNTQSLLGGALLGQKKYADAEPFLLKGYDGMKQREKTIPPQTTVRLPEALDRLIELYTATEKPDEVKKWQAERAKYPPPATPAPPTM